MISAKIIADSLNPRGERITSMQVTFPRIILAEFNTHRMFSRNTASSRAIPFEKMLKSIEENPFVPIAWQKGHSGMQGAEYHEENISHKWVAWNEAKKAAINYAKQLSNQDVTKQICNRLLEPFMWTTVVVTATEWENFFALRCPQYKPIAKVFRSRKECVNYYRNLKGQLLDGSIVTAEHTASYWEKASELEWLSVNKGQAEIHMMALAEAMWDAYNESAPKQLRWGEWHIPYENDIKINQKELEELWLTESDQDLENEDHSDLKVQISTVMCARTSYTVVGEDQKPMSYQKMIALHNKMEYSKPFHASPFEHNAQASENKTSSGNFRGGWLQYRELIELGTNA